MKNISAPLSIIANIALWVLTVFITYTFALSSYHMLSGESKMVEFFNKFGGENLRYTIAILEGLGAILILIPGTVILGASLLTIALIGILTGNMSSLGGVPGEPVLMLVLTLVLLVGRFSFPATLNLGRSE